MPQEKKEKVQKADKIAIATSGNQVRAIENFAPSALILNIFSLSENDATIFRYEFARVFFMLIAVAPIIALLSLLHVLSFNRYPYYYALSGVVIGCALFMGFRIGNASLKEKVDVIFSNDHFFLLRGIIQAWHEKYNLIYVQHGLIGPKFPNPNCFDEIYFDSDYSRMQYDFEISEDKIRYSSNSRFANNKISIKSVPENNPDVRIGLAFQDPKYADDVISQNLEVFEASCGLMVRLHPRLIRDRSLIEKYPNLDIHFGSDVSMAEFFQNIDLLASEASSLLIDSLFYGTPSVQLNTSRLGDYYGLARQAIIPSVNEVKLDIAIDKARNFDFASGLSAFGARI